MNLSDIIPDGIPQGYFNGYAIGNSNQDFVIILSHNGRPTIALNSTPSHVKSLAIHLHKMIEELEKQTGQTIVPFVGNEGGPVEEGSTE